MSNNPLGPSVLQLSREEDKRVLLNMMERVNTPQKKIDTILREWDEETEKMILEKYGKLPI